jgi:hypothetical protein
LERFEDGSRQTFPAVDMGGGLVAQATADVRDYGDGLLHVGEQTRFELCATGRAIEVWGDHVPYPDRTPTEVAVIVQESIASPNIVTLDEIRERIASTTTWGGRVVEARESESCGCTIYYPEAYNAGAP